jgi:hypothetical protein
LFAVYTLLTTFFLGSLAASSIRTRILYIVNAKKLDRFVVDTQSKLHTMMRYIPIPAAIVTSVTILMSGGDALRSRI